LGCMTGAGYRQSNTNPAPLVLRMPTAKANVAVIKYSVALKKGEKFTVGVSTIRAY
jgi:hypothetical protein